MPSSPIIHFFYNCPSFTFKDRAALKSFILKLFRKEGYSLESLNYIFCTDDQLLKINNEFLQHDFYTDIITFDLSSTDKIQAEIYISVDRVKENALTHGVSFKKELHRVIFHGALHLCEYGDKSNREKKEMTQREDFYLKSYSLN